VWLCVFFLGVVALCSGVLAARLYFAFRWKGNVKTITSAAVVFFFAMLGVAQTNTVTTNSIPKSPEQIQAEKLAAVRKAMPRYFSYTEDENKTRSMVQITDDTLKQDSDGYVKLSLMCVIVPPDKIPDTVNFQIISKGESWNFTEGLEYPITADGKPLKPKTQKIMSNLNDVEHDPYHLDKLIDSLSEEVTLEQFKELAWAKKVWFKTDSGFVEVAPAARQKWKLMWNYFDLLKAEISNTESKQ
jgi:hypothetical protein